MPGRKGSLGGMNRNYTITSLPVRASSTGAESGGADSTFSRKMAAPYRPELIDDEIEQEEDEWFEKNGKPFDELLLRKYISEVIENDMLEMNTVASVSGVGPSGTATSPFGYTLPLGMKGQGDPRVDVYKSRKKRKKRRIKESTLPPSGVAGGANTNQSSTFKFDGALIDFNENNKIGAYLFNDDLIGEGDIGGAGVFINQNNNRAIKIFKKQRKPSGQLEYENYKKAKAFQHLKSFPKIFRVGDELMHHYYVEMEKLIPLNDDEKSLFMQSVHPLFQPGYQQDTLFEEGGVNIFKSSYHDTFIKLLEDEKGEERIKKINANLERNVNETLFHKILYRASKQMIKRRDLMPDEEAEKILMAIAKSLSKQSYRKAIIKRAKQNSAIAFSNFKINMQEDVQVTSDPTGILNFINAFFKKLSEHLGEEIKLVRSLMIESMNFARRVIKKGAKRISEKAKIRIYSMILSCVYTDIFLAPIGFKLNTSSDSGNKFGRDFKASDLGGPAGGKYLTKTLKKAGKIKMIELLRDIQEMKNMQIEAGDLHSENIMKRSNGDYVIADLGAFKFN